MFAFLVCSPMTRSPQAFGDIVLTCKSGHTMHCLHSSESPSESSEYYFKSLTGAANTALHSRALLISLTLSPINILLIC